MADRLWLGHRCAHSLGALFKLAANAFAVDGGGMAIPGEAFDADLRDIAAEAAIAFKKCGFDTGARRSQCCRQPTGAGADNKHIGFADHVNLPRGFFDGTRHRWVFSQLGATWKGALDGASIGLPRI